jgi:hypothetical protein
MFQKLYRHLEEINNSLREDRTGATNQMGEAIIDQLASLNATVHALQAQLAAENSASVSKDIKRETPVRRTILWIVLAAAVIPLLLFMAFTLAQINRGVSNQAVNAPFSTTAVVPIANTAVVAPADVAGNRVAVQHHLATLDSLIAAQEQAVAELKKLNTTAVWTMRSIRRHFVLSERAAKTRSSMPIDSFTTAR